MGKHILFVSLILISFCSFGQDEKFTLPDSVEISGIDTTLVDTTQVVVEKHVQDAEDSKFEIAIKGFVKLNALYDFNGMRNTEGFRPIEIPIDSSLNSAFQGLYVGARQSRIGFEGTATTKLGAIYTYIEGDFAGDKTGLAFRLRHAYGTIGFWTFGQTWTTFSNLSAVPKTVDYDGPNSGTTIRQGQIRFAKKFAGENQFAFSVENPQKDFLNPFDSLRTDFQRDFDFIGRLRIAEDWGQVQIAFVSRVLTYTTQGGKSDWTPGGGLSFSGTVRPKKVGKFYWHAIAGQGIARYIDGLRGFNLDGVFDSNGNLNTLFAYSYFVGYEYRFTEKVMSTLVFGQTGIENNSQQPENAFSGSRYASVNVFWRIIPSFEIGAEGTWGDKKVKDGRSADATRMQFMARFDF